MCCECYQTDKLTFVGENNSALHRSDMVTHHAKAGLFLFVFALYCGAGQRLLRRRPKSTTTMKMFSYTLNKENGLHFFEKEGYGFALQISDFAEVIGRIKIDIFRELPVIRPDKRDSTMYPDISAYFSKTRENKTGKAVWEYDCPYAYVASGDYLYFTLTIHFANTDYVIRNRLFVVSKNKTAFLDNHDDFRKNRLYKIKIKWPTL